MSTTPNTIVAASLGYNGLFKSPFDNVNKAYTALLQSKDVNGMRINMQFLINELASHAAKTLDQLVELRDYAIVVDKGNASLDLFIRASKQHNRLSTGAMKLKTELQNRIAKPQTLSDLI